MRSFINILTTLLLVALGYALVVFFTTTVSALGAPYAREASMIFGVSLALLLSIYIYTRG